MLHRETFYKCPLQCRLLLMTLVEITSRRKYDMASYEVKGSAEYIAYIQGEIDRLFEDIFRTKKLYF